MAQTGNRLDWTQDTPSSIMAKSFNKTFYRIVPSMDGRCGRVLYLFMGGTNGGDSIKIGSYEATHSAKIAAAHSHNGRMTRELHTRRARG